jgi:NAD(P)-dependent dehydrogenase (short-subunit alcohol dehydrogenase family)
VYKHRAKDFYEKNIDYFNEVSHTIPAGRYTQVEDIAITAEFLLIHAPSTINGLEITIDGGLSTLDQSNLIDRFNPLGKKL